MPQHQPVALIKKPVHRLVDGRVAEERDDELGGAVRLVAAREATGQGDDLAALDGAHNRCTDSSMSRGERLRSTTICASAPARSKARAVSYSQLVPGKTGTTTLGRAMPTLGLTLRWQS